MTHIAPPSGGGILTTKKAGLARALHLFFAVENTHILTLAAERDFQR